MKKRFKIAVALLILAATIGVFIHYASTHPALLKALGDVNPFLLIALAIGYILMFFALVLVLRASLRLYGKTLSWKENLLLNAYSSLVNFFGPGQSGPALRGLYLKKRHSLGIKQYMFATLLYYVFYALLSALLLFVGSRTWWQTALLVLAASGGGALLLRWYAGRSKLKNEPGINMVNVGWLLAATALQVAVQTMIFGLELREVQTNVSLAQVLTYTGAANFALFVALTPGAIGIREAFLVFTHGLHHLSNTIIVAANVIDRAVYLLFLGILFILTVSLHARDTLKLKQLRASKAPDQP